MIPTPTITCPNQQFLTITNVVYARYMEKYGYNFVDNALYDLEGNLLNARHVETRFGWAWAITNADGSTTWFNESQAKSCTTYRRNNAKKGIYVGTAVWSARARTIQSGSLYQLEIVPKEAIETLDNGQPETAEYRERFHLFTCDCKKCVHARRADYAEMYGLSIDEVPERIS